MRLPILVSLPHAGLKIAPEVAENCVLSDEEILKDSDEGASEIYNIAEEVEEYATTEIARAIVDLNRAPDDLRPDGVVKTVTCWNDPVYSEPLSEKMIKLLLEKYYHPYHEKLRNLSEKVLLGIDCHTMAATGPPLAPDTGEERPYICLSNGDHTCPDPWFELMARCFENSFGFNISVNYPFKGGYIIKSHKTELPWIQIEFSRADFMSKDEKRKRMLKALREWCGYM